MHFNYFLYILFRLRYKLVDNYNEFYEYYFLIEIQGILFRYNYTNLINLLFLHTFINTYTI